MGSRYAAAYAQLVGGGTQQGEPPAPAAIVTSPQLASGASQRASPIPGATLVFSHRVSATYNAAEARAARQRAGYPRLRVCVQRLTISTSFSRGASTVFQLRGGCVAFAERRHQRGHPHGAPSQRQRPTSVFGV